MTNPNWKPQPGKPAMTRDETTLVTDLEVHPKGYLWSAALETSWWLSGHFSRLTPKLDLIEPTAAILAAHGIDADGKPVVKERVPPEADALGHRTRISDSSRYDERCVLCGATDERGSNLLIKRCPKATPDAPAPPTPIDVAYIPAAKLAEIMELAKRQPYGTPIAIEHDGFKGVVIGYYIRLDGVPGIVAQLDDARVVHVYGEKWLKPAPEVAKREGR